MNISKEYTNKTLTMSVSGEIDTFAASEFENEINSEINTFDSLILDFENLEYISSGGLRVLISTQKKLQPQQKTFKIINSPEIIKDILAETGLTEILTIE